MSLKEECVDLRIQLLATILTKPPPGTVPLQEGRIHLQTQAPTIQAPMIQQVQTIPSGSEMPQATHLVEIPTLPPIPATPSNRLRR